MGKLAWSLIVSTVVLYIAKQVDWISLGEGLPLLTTNVFWNQFIWLGIIACVFTATSYVIGRLYALFVIATLGFGCFLLPVVILGSGYLKLMAVTYLLPGFTHTGVWWQVLLLSIMVGLSYPSEKTDSDSGKSTTQTRTASIASKPWSTPTTFMRPKPVKRTPRYLTPPDLGKPVHAETYEEMVLRLKKEEEQRKAKGS